MARCRSAALAARATVEADEPDSGKYDTPRERATKRYYPVTKGGRSGPANKRAVLALVERGGNQASFTLPCLTR